MADTVESQSEFESQSQFQGLNPSLFFSLEARESSQLDQLKILKVLSALEYQAWFEVQESAIQDFLLSINFLPEPGKFLVMPLKNKILVLVIKTELSLETLALCQEALPPGDYELEGLSSDHLIQAAIGWGLQAYEFSKYKKSSSKLNKSSVLKRLILSEENLKIVLPYCQAHYLIRDLINTPADDMGPSELAQAAFGVAQKFSANFECIRGEDLRNNFPAIHAVGRASDDGPCLIQFSWGNKAHKKLILIGKGVCFDSGGLNLKDPEGMRWMKKDMGGAAHVLGLAELIMQAKLNLFLEVYIPAVENSVSGNAYRPGDVVRTRQGLSIEIGNTDAEGRVILADALCLASEQKPDLIIDFATLTGAARVALGPDLPALFSNDLHFSNVILEMGLKYEDPLWPMPLFQPYKAYLKSPIADLNNMSKVSYGGAITAALFLENFVGSNISWCHIDLMAFNTSSRAARPEGGEAMSLRAVFHAIEKRYGKN